LILVHFFTLRGRGFSGPYGRGVVTSDYITPGGVYFSGGLCMKTVNFPQPVHEQAVEVMEKAKKELEALGYKGGYTCKLISNADTYAVFQIDFTAGIEC